MSKPGEFLTKHRNAFLLLLLVSTLAQSSLAGQSATPATVDIPITETAAAALSPLQEYRLQRDKDALSDIAALEELIAQPLLEASTREDAAARLQEIIDCRQAQAAMEGALVSSSLGPCVVVIEGGSLTVVTGKKQITAKDSALVLTLTEAHTGIAPGNVKIITAN